MDIRKNQKNTLLPKGIIVLASNELTQRQHDAAYHFIQESHFLYLSGIEEPGWWLIIDTISARRWLVAPTIDRVHLLFDGSLSWDDARSISGIDDVISRAGAKTLLTDLAKKHQTVFTLGADPREKHYTFVVNPAQARMRTMLKKLFVNVEDCRQELAKLRAIKQPEEIASMKAAATLTVETFAQLKESLTNLKHEYEVEAELTYHFRRHGADGHAYDPIVASGTNALTLHYTNNNDPLPENGLVLIDAGARVKGYCADVTRTYAIGTPSDRQKAVHAAVEKAHHAIIALLGPEKSVKEYHDEVDEIMKSALKSLGLYKKPSDYRNYFPHAISHGLGIDVHDSLGAPTHFKPGMVLTVEPGIYIPEEGIGVRIEDDILITETGIENLTGALSTSL